MSDKKLNLTAHLSQLRSHLIKSVIFITVASFAVYSRIDEVLRFMIRPVGRLTFIAPQEAFIANIKIAVFLGIFLSSPFIIYQVWRFIASGLTQTERRYALLFGIVSFFLFIAQEKTCRAFYIYRRGNAHPSGCSNAGFNGSPASFDV